MRDAPLTHDKPERRDRRAESHFCPEVGSTVYCDRLRCSLCDLPDEVDPEDIEHLDQEGDR
jgi:hypothetical protein